MYHVERPPIPSRRWSKYTQATSMRKQQHELLSWVGKTWRLWMSTGRLGRPSFTATYVLCLAKLCKIWRGKKGVGNSPQNNNKKKTPGLEGWQLAKQLALCALKHVCWPRAQTRVLIIKSVKKAHRYSNEQIVLHYVALSTPSTGKRNSVHIKNV